MRLKVAGEGNVADSAGSRRQRLKRRRRRRKLTPKAEPKVEPEAAEPATGAGEIAGLPSLSAAPKPAPAARRQVRRAPTARSRWRRPPFACAPATPASICVRLQGPDPPAASRHEDLDAFIARGPAAGGKADWVAPNTSVEDIKVVGLRRKIAEKMRLAKSRIPHITYVEEIDVTALEDLRAALNKDKRADQPKLTILPFLMRAMVKAIAEQPQLNALFDDDAGVIHQHGGVHIGMAAQTPTGLVVPVIKHAEARDLWDCAPR